MINLILDKDNLDVLKSMADESVDAFIFDPPFNSNRNYASTPNDEGSIQVMRDAWKGGVESYLHDIRKRIEEMLRILTLTGTLIIHCDDTAGFDLHRMLINKGLYLRNDIIWSYSGGGISKCKLPCKHDHLYVFSKTNDPKKWVYNPIMRQYGSRTRIRGKRSTYSGGADIDLDKGTPITDVWDARSEDSDREMVEREGLGWAFYPDFGQINPVTGTGKQQGAANTEKPLPVYKRLVYVYTNEGQTVCDPYMGGGTTILAAAELNRNGIGIDQDLNAFKRAKSRFITAEIEFTSSGDNSYKNYINKDPDTFSDHDWGTFMIEQDGGQANPRRSGDGGVDGYNDAAHIVYQAKKHSKKIAAKVVRETHSAGLARKARLGWSDCTIKIISKLGFTKDAQTKAYEIMNNDPNFKVCLITGEELLRERKLKEPLIINVIRKNDNLEVVLSHTHKTPVKYGWYIEKKTNQQFLFANFIPKPVVKQTSTGLLNLSEINIKDYNYGRCEIVFSDGSKEVKEFRP